MQLSAIRIDLKALSVDTQRFGIFAHKLQHFAEIAVCGNFVWLDLQPSSKTSRCQIVVLERCVDTAEIVVRTREVRIDMHSLLKSDFCPPDIAHRTQHMTQIVMGKGEVSPLRDGILKCSHSFR